MGMPAILFDLQSRGFHLDVMGNQLRVVPASMLTDDLRASIRAHKPEILAALEARQDSVTPSPTPQPPEPQDSAQAVREAVEERAAILEFEAELPRWRVVEVVEAAQAFYGHIFGPGNATGCCRAQIGKYCAEDERLRAAYYARCQS